MPPISSHMHFGKIFIESSDDEIDIKSYLIGIVAPDTIYDEDIFEDMHYSDEDGNIDVREFYEQFNLKNLNLQEKSFILGYYSHLWFEEYYKFNASKLTIYNNLNLSDEDLSLAVKNVIKYYDAKAIGDYYSKEKSEILDYNLKINLKEIKGINIKDAKVKINDYFKEEIPKAVYSQLLDESSYMNFIKKSCKKIYKSL